MRPSPAAPQSALVLGATGFVGRWVARRLSAVGADLHLAVRDPARAHPVFSAYAIDGAVHPIDLRQPGEVRELVARTRPDTVFNLAGYGVDRSERDESAAFAINRDLVAAVCEILLDVEPASRPALVHVGSALEYGQAAGDLNETTAPRPDTLYGTSKLEGTRAVAAARAAGLDAVTARLFMVYGPGEHAQRLVPTLIAARDGTDRIPLTEGLQRRDFTFVDDVAEGLLRLAASIDGCPATLNLATGRLHRVRDFVEILADEAGIDASRLGFGDLPGRVSEMQHEPVAVARLRDALGGWTPGTAPRAGVRATLAFHRSTDTLPS
ncbi:MAG: NAD(P)-dependent oxidoreductase [Gemmatimonadetes bacterium]|nr:NAD(P)-dependent oxidoreductase [Gemmatimonadota bacterium]